MNISVECYEELYLKDKDAEAIIGEVENIRRHIERIKYEMEAPAYAYENRSFPSRALDVAMYRKYLERALEYLSSVRGEISLLSEEEKASRLFDRECENISCVSLTIGRYLEQKYELVLRESVCTVMRLRLDGEPEYSELDLEDTVSKLYDLHMGEWHESYTPEQYSCTLDEPSKWHLRIDYKNGAVSRTFEGLGIFPYNFDALLKILGADSDLY